MTTRIEPYSTFSIYNLETHHSSKFEAISPAFHKVIEDFIFQPRFHAGSYTSFINIAIKPLGAGYKSATKLLDISKAI